MRKAIRCCISCILPCGALDVIRIVHANGHVEEITHAVRAADVMQAHPKHVLRKPPSSWSMEEGSTTGSSKTVILPPTAELKKGHIYFLMPTSSSVSDKTRAAAGSGRRRRKRREANANAPESRGLLLSDDQYLSEILSEKVSLTTHRDQRRRGRVGVWRPHLESISEVPNDL